MIMHYTSHKYPSLWLYNFQVNKSIPNYYFIVWSTYIPCYVHDTLTFMSIPYLFYKALVIIPLT